MPPPLPVLDPEPMMPPPGPPPPPDIATLAAIESNFYRAKNERLILLLNFLQTPLNAVRDEDGNVDADVRSAHNLAVTAALQCIRTITSADLQVQAPGSKVQGDS